MRVLLVGNSRLLAKALKKGLEEEGHTVEVAPLTPGETGRVRTAGCAAVILDLSHPPDAGLALLERRGREGLDKPVLVLESPGANRQARASDSEAVTWLPKPFELDRVLTWLRDREQDNHPWERAPVLLGTTGSFAW